MSSERKSHKLDWSQVSAAKAEPGALEAPLRICLVQSEQHLLAQLGAGAFDQRTASPESISGLFGLITEIVVDLQQAAGFVKTPFIFLDEHHPQRGGKYAHDKAEDRHLIYLNRNLFFEAAAELETFLTTGQLDTQNVPLARFLFTVVHEVAHMRQRLKLSLEKDYDSNQVLTNDDEALRYLTAHSENNANGATIRYLRHKQEVSSEHSIWNQLSFASRFGMFVDSVFTSRAIPKILLLVDQAEPLLKKLDIHYEDPDNSQLSSDQVTTLNEQLDAINEMIEKIKQKYIKAHSAMGSMTDLDLLN